MDACPCDACQAYRELTRPFDPGAGYDRTVWTSGSTLAWETVEQELLTVRELGRMLESIPRPAFRFPSASEVLAALTPDTPQFSRLGLAAGREDDVAAQVAAEVAPEPIDATPTRPRSFAQWQREAADLLALSERQRR
jgi:hypothetical protein